MSNLSNTYGRALEYIVVETMRQSSLGNTAVSLTSRAIGDQERDRIKFISLPKKLQQDFILYAKGINDWFITRFNPNGIINIDRLPDSEAKKGDVSDIRLIFDGECVNLSIKHNHSAVKHQRPSNTAIQCGFAKNSNEDVFFREKYHRVTNEFQRQTNEYFPKVSSFNEIKVLDPMFIVTNLYKPICELVINFIQTKCKSQNTMHLFKFIIGNFDFYKIQAIKNKLVIQEFAKISMPDRVEVGKTDLGYITLEFSNGFSFLSRLHTASTSIKHTNLKFDTHLEKIIVPESVIYL